MLPKWKGWFLDGLKSQYGEQQGARIGKQGRCRKMPETDNAACAARSRFRLAGRDTQHPIEHYLNFLLPPTSENMVTIRATEPRKTVK
jgi:hypothetical protein